MNYFYRITVTGLPTEEETPLIQLAIQNGSSGSSESLMFSQPNLTFDPRIHKKKTKSIDLFFNEEPSTDFLEKIKSLYPLTQTQIHKEPHKDWLEEWKKGFAPFCLTSPYWVVPSWTESPVDPELSILIDPGMAFGTGTHATTQIAAYLIKSLCSHKSFKKPKSLLDIGTGTGILAILADRMGVTQVKGIDIDPECLRVSKENILRNEAKHTQIEETHLEQISPSFDCVVANIIDGVLLRLKSDLLRIIHSDSHLILSGILVENEDSFIDKFIDQSPLRIERRIEKEGWVGFWLRNESEK